MSRKALGVGFGLSALVPSSSAPAGPSSTEANPAAPSPARRQESAPMEIEIAKIIPNRYQPRQTFDPANLTALAQSIKHHGVIQPIVVCPLAGADGNSFELIAGERRMRAATLAGFLKIPAIVKALNDRGMMEYALIENVQREDLNPIDKAKAYARLLGEFASTQEEIAERVGVDRSSVTNTLRLLNLPDVLQNEIAEGGISMGHAKILLSLTTSKLQIQFAEQIKSHGLSVRQLEALVQTSPKKKAASKDKAKQQAPEIVALERRFLHALGTKVSVTPSKKGSGGEIKIIYYSLDDLDRILEAVEGGKR